jgi:dTDP-4-amino-4,6-dideoxygalactose transaminase
MNIPMRVPFVDLPRRFAAHRDELHAAVDRVLSHGEVILGREVEAFERGLSHYLGARHSVGVANATDGLTLGMRGQGIGPGDEVITSSMSYLATTSSIVHTGATPVFADVGDDLNLDPIAIENAITPTTKAISIVHLAGNPANMTAISALAQRHQLLLIEDCAQAFGARHADRHCGQFGHVGVYSFHPLKNLCTLGDGGALTTPSAPLAAWLRQARNHGHRNRDECDFWSINSRLDALHAGFLQVMLQNYPSFLAARCEQANHYRNELSDVVSFPNINPMSEPSYGMFVILATQRDQLQDFLLAHGIETKIHYPIPIHRLHAARNIALRAPLPQTEYYTQRILSLPIGAHLAEIEQDYVISHIKRFYKGHD